MLLRPHLLPVALSLASSLALARPAPPGAATATTLTGTVRAVDAVAHTLDVVTGVGLALRVIKLSWSEETRVNVAGTAAPASALKPGEIVRVEYTKGERGNVAKTIERLPTPGQGGGR
jgi:hypothetical protein